MDLSRSQCFRDFSQKLPIFPTLRVFNAPAEGVRLASAHRRIGKKTRMMGLPDRVFRYLYPFGYNTRT